MSDVDVDADGMKRRLSNSDAESLIAGRPVEGASSQVTDMLSTMRQQATTGPGVPISGALTEFIVDRTPSVTSIGGASTARLRGPRRIARKAAAAFTIVPAKIFVGATVAAAVGGAQTLGIVDVPLLPGPEPVVVTTVPVESVTPTTSVMPPTTAATVDASVTTPDASASTVLAPDTTAVVPDTTAVVPSTTAVVPSTTAVASSTTIVASSTTVNAEPARPPASAPPVTSPPTAPTSDASDDPSGCDFGQETSGRRDGESNARVPEQRPDVPANQQVPPIDPCSRQDDDPPGQSQSDAAAPSTPADPGRGGGAPSPVPGENGDRSDRGNPAQDTEDGPGRSSHSSGGTASEDAPSSHGGNGNAGSATGSAEPPRNSGQGRTPPGD